MLNVNGNKRAIAKVAVRPGSLLTPGVLKNIFNAGEQAVDDETP